MLPKWCCIVACLLLSLLSTAQQAASREELEQVPAEFYAAIDKKVSKLGGQLARQSEKYLRRLSKKEALLRRKLSRIDSSAAAALAAEANEKYRQLESKLKQLPNSGDYFPLLDTLKTSLNFLSKDNISENLKGKVNASLGNIEGLEAQFKKAEIIKQFIRERRNLLKLQFNHPAFSRHLRSINKDIYYYHQAVSEYKELVNQPEKIERKAIDLLSKSKIFRDFLKKNSLLASIFNFPTDPGSAAYQANLAGLQTRVQVNQLVQQQFAGTATAPAMMMQQSIQQAQQHLRQLKDKVNKALPSADDGDASELPNFKPNNQKTKRFLDRIELGTNVQSTKTNYFFPTTTDLALSLGYRLNDKSIIGIGASYKVGWGKDFRNIVVTSQGAGLRSFVDIKIKGSFHASSGYEYNYQPVAITTADRPGAWTQSGLVGISKVVSLKTKFFKKTRVQLLWDFLSYQQVPQTPAIKFRVGYIF